MNFLLDMKQVSQDGPPSHNSVYRKNKWDRKMMTINYFGNINDKLIGQIKTKIPLQDKKLQARTFQSPEKDTYLAVEENPTPLGDQLLCRQEQAGTLPRTYSQQVLRENSK